MGFTLLSAPGSVAGGTLANPPQVMGKLNSLVPLLKKGRKQSWAAWAQEQEKALRDLSKCDESQRRGEVSCSVSQRGGERKSAWQAWKDVNRSERRWRRMSK